MLRFLLIINHRSHLSRAVLTCLLSVNTTYAKDTNNYNAAISFADVETAKSIVYRAHMELASIDKVINKMQNLALKVMSGTVPNSELYFLDIKFQDNKHSLDKILNQGTFWFTAFNSKEIAIEVFYSGEHYSFLLPKMTIEDLFISTDDVSSVDHAKTSITNINNANDKISSLLPDNIIIGSLKKFASPFKQDASQYPVTLSVSTSEDTKTLMRSLVDLNHQLKEMLNRMISIANEAATGEHSASEMANFNTEFQSLKAELNRRLQYSCVFGDINRFNNNKLSFKWDGHDREYVFTKLNLSLLNLQNDTILDSTASERSSSDISLVHTWLQDWIISGNSPLKGI